MTNCKYFCPLTNPTADDATQAVFPLGEVFPSLAADYTRLNSSDMGGAVHPSVPWRWRSKLFPDSAELQDEQIGIGSVLLSPPLVPPRV